MARKSLNVDDALKMLVSIRGAENQVRDSDAALALGDALPQGFRSIAESNKRVNLEIISDNRESIMRIIAKEMAKLSVDDLEDTLKLLK